MIVLKRGVEIAPFDNGLKDRLYLLSYNNRNWKVSETVYMVCGLLKDELSQLELYNRINEDSSIQCSLEQVNTIIEFFKSNGLIEGFEDVQGKKKNSMLWGRITLFPEKILIKLKVMDFIFNKYFFIIGTGMIVMWMLWIYHYNSSANVAYQLTGLQFREMVICYCCIMLFGIIHEFGHVIALLKYGERPGRIGIGIYLFMPVFFSEVTKAWKIKRIGRVCVDIGGVYLQALVLMLTFVINMFYIKNKTLAIAILLSSFQILSNFNPFIKLDGYWFLCDALGITDIHKALYELFIELFAGKSKFHFEIRGLSKGKKSFLYGYMILITGFMIYFVKVVLSSTLLALKLFNQDFIELFMGRINWSSINFSVVLNYISNRVSSIIMLIFAARIIYILIWKNVKLISQKTRRQQSETH